MTDQARERSGWEVRANLVCTLCARTAGTAQGSHARPLALTSIRVVEADHAEAVRRLRCPYCSGRLWLQDREEIHVGPHTLSGEELHPRRGRPRRVSRAT
jgi:DNA-directed RNA polymerase subunit RPC12/RpoP